MASIETEELKRKCRGVQVILATPFNESDALDELGLRRNIRYVLSRGVQILTTMGTNSEFFAVSPEEHQRIIKVVVEEARSSNALVVVGTSSTSTKVAIELSQYAERCGADAVMVAPPYYMPANPAEILAHYQELNRSVGIGIVLYYMPQVHRGHMSLQLLSDLASMEKVVGIKWCELDLHPFTTAVRHLGQKITFISGYGEHLAPYTYMLGVNAYSSTIAAYAPEFSVELHRAGMNQEWDKVMQMALQTFELYDFAVRTGVGMALTKEALKIAGLAAGRLRLPMSSVLTDADRKQLAQILRGFGVSEETM